MNSLVHQPSIIRIVLISLLSSIVLAANFPAAAAEPPAPAQPGPTAPIQGTPVRSFVGRILSIDTNANSFLIRLNNDDEYHVRFGTNTRSRLNGPVLKATDFKKGDTVVIRGTPGQEGEILATLANNRSSAPVPTMAPKKQPPAPPAAK